MITDVRNKFKSSFARIVLWIVIFSLAGILSIPQIFKDMGGGPWAIKVNDRKVSVDAYSKSTAYWQEWLAQVRGQYGEYADFLLRSMGLQPNPQTLAYDALVKKELLGQQVQAVGLSLHHEHIMEQIKHPTRFGQEMLNLVPTYVIDMQTGQVDERMLHAHLKQMGITISEFEEQVEGILARHLFTEIIGDSVYVPSFDIEQKVLSEQGQRTFNIITLSYDDMLKQEKKKKIAQEELTQFYSDQNKSTQRYFVPEKRSGTVWVFDPNTYEVTVTPEVIETYYNKHKIEKYIDTPTQVQIRYIKLKFDAKNKEKVQKRAQELRDELIKNPDSFADIAKKESQDKKTAQDGGLMPFFSKGELNETLERAAFMLEKDGDISGVLTGEDSFEIIQRVAKKMRVFKALDKVKAEIEKKLKQDKFERVFQADMKRIVTRDKQEKDAALEELIKQKGSKPQDLKDLVVSDGRNAQQLFDIKVEGGLGFFVENGNGHAVKLTGITRAYAPELESIKNTVIEDMYADRAHTVVRERIKKAHAQVDTTGLDTIAYEIGGTLETTEVLESAKSEKAKKLQERGVPIAQAFQLEKKGSALALDQPRDGYVIVLDNITSSPSSDDAGIRRIKKQLNQERKRSITEGFVASLYKHATIDINQALPFNAEYK